MPGRRWYVYKCTDCGGATNPLDLMRLGGKPRPDFRARDGRAEAAVRVYQVLCWWCRTYHPPEEVETCMKIPERHAEASNGTGSSSKSLVAGLLTPFCEIWAFLTGTDSATGKKRQPGNLSLRLSSGQLAVTLNDAETCQYCSLMGDSLDDLLLLAEAGLSDGSLPWRPSQYAKPKRR